MIDVHGWNDEYPAFTDGVPAVPGFAAALAGDEGAEAKGRPPGPLGPDADRDALLVITANNSSASHPVTGTSRKFTRRGRRMAVEIGQRLVASTCGDMAEARRIVKCGTVPCSKGGVVVRRSAEGYAYAGGVSTCGSIWACAACSFKIRLKRSADIKAAVEKHIAGGGGVMFSSLTIRHDTEDDLAGLWDMVQAGWEYMANGRPFRRFKEQFGITGHIKAVEVTHGGNGWHPHLHVLWFIDRPLSPFDDDDSDFYAFRKFLRERWVAFFAVRHGMDVSQRFGVRTDPVSADSAESVGEYVSKIGYELALADMKVGRDDGQRQPFAIARDASRWGDKADVELFRTFLRASHGRRAITWSYGLRAALLGTAEKTDQELAGEAETGSETVAQVDNELWKELSRRRDGAKTRFLECFEPYGSGFEGALGVLRSCLIEAELEQQTEGPPLYRATPCKASNQLTN